MRDGMTRTRVILGAAALATVLIGALLAAVPTASADTGTLKLKIRPCSYSSWLDSAKVEVDIYRPEQGVIDSDTDYTDSEGYVAITFTGLQNGDQARVTVTPQEQSPDDDHTYYWVSGALLAGEWDIEASAESLCEDDWYDEEENIILCLYQ
ncbi:MAG: hypothetical protein GF346_04405 [Candidatus Eisenbacteria bacterium]|nr:hypothetical protein [Candidatus Latescibacterota bacterium]MBD3301669.1 hypothetical protein [Candidatus Eisenbacteria bacterium]